MPTIRGTINDDTLNGTGGKDWIYGQLGNDTINGAAGNDYLSGNDGNDALNGGDGNDALYGGMGVDSLDGGLGNDMLDGGHDSVKDTLMGGEGDDTAAVHSRDWAYGGAGSDTLAIDGLDSEAAVRYTINLSKIGGASAATIGWGGIRAAGFEQASVSLGEFAANSFVIGSAGDDAIFGGISSSLGTAGIRLDGAAGDDVISGSNKNDTILGGAGTDQLAGNFGADTLTGGADSDHFVADLNFLFGAPEPDVITDFNAAADFFLVGNPLLSGVFPPPNVDQANPLRSGSAPTANSTRGQFLYDTDDGRLSYDPDGTGRQAAVHIFTLETKPTLTASNFIFDF